MAQSATFLMTRNFLEFTIMMNFSIYQNLCKFGHKLREIDKILTRNVIFYTMGRFSQKAPDRLFKNYKVTIREGPPKNSSSVEGSKI